MTINYPKYIFGKQSFYVFLQIKFVAKRGNSTLGFVALDDVELRMATDCDFSPIEAIPTSSTNATSSRPIRSTEQPNNSLHDQQHVKLHTFLKIV